MRAKVVSEDMGAKENGAKVRLAQKYSLTYLKIKLQIRRLWVGWSCWGRGI
jgi:hypothetical protein